MESVPLPDASVDALVCMYAFHEMPEDARLAAVQEFYRSGFGAVIVDIYCVFAVVCSLAR